jgi:hypothetical protein
MNIKKRVVSVTQWLFFSLFIALLAAILYAAHELRG